MDHLDPCMAVSDGDVDSKVQAMLATRETVIKTRYMFPVRKRC